MDMKKTLILTFIMSLLPSLANAEKYVCSYLFNGEANSIVYERNGNFFKKSNGAEDLIVFEDQYAIVLSSTYTLNGTEEPSTFTQ